MSKKYELLKDNYIEYKGKILYRIKALKDFGDVKKGDIGGCVESEKNLSYYGNCWVYDNAKVYDKAIIHDNAKIYGNAEIYDNTIVYNNAEVCDSAIVYNNVEVCGNAKIYGNAEIFGYAEIYNNARVYGKARVYGYAEIYDNAKIYKGMITGKISIPYKDIFQYQCQNRILTAILTENYEILYTIGCQENITKEEFLDRIYNEGGGLKGNPHREEYLRLIPVIEMYFKGYK